MQFIKLDVSNWRISKLPKIPVQIDRRKGFYCYWNYGTFLSYYDCRFGRKYLSRLFIYLLVDWIFEKNMMKLQELKQLYLIVQAHIALHFVALRNLLIQSDNESLGCTQFSGPWNGIPNHCIAHRPYSAKNCPKKLKFLPILIRL